MQNAVSVSMTLLLQERGVIRCLIAPARGVHCMQCALSPLMGIVVVLILSRLLSD